MDRSLEVVVGVVWRTSVVSVFSVRKENRPPSSRCLRPHTRRRALLAPPASSAALPCCCVVLMARLRRVTRSKQPPINSPILTTPTHGFGAAIRPSHTYNTYSLGRGRVRKARKCLRLSSATFNARDGLWRLLASASLALTRVRPHQVRDAQEARPRMPERSRAPLLHTLTTHQGRLGVVGIIAACCYNVCGRVSTTAGAGA